MRTNNLSNPSQRKDTSLLYADIKQQLEAQNQILMQQRRNINNRTSRDYENLRTDQSAFMSCNENQSQEEQKNQVIKEKIKDIMEICMPKGENSSQNKYQDILEAEEYILNHIDKMSSKKPQNKNSQNKIDTKSQQIVTFNRQIPSDTQREHLRASIGDDAMEMIQAIQAKALLQIENLRNSKIHLMKKLNIQMKEHNQEKKKVIFLEKKVSQLISILQKTGIKFEKIKLNQWDQKMGYDRNNSHLTDNKYTNFQQSPVKIHLEASLQSNRKQNRPQTAIPEQNFETEIQRLSYENKKMKNILSDNNSNNLKQKLRQQVLDLTRKVKGYQNLLQNKSHISSTQAPLENLYLQGNYLAQGVQDLIRNKMNGRPGSNEPKTQQYLREVKFLKNRISELEKQNSSYQLKEKNQFTRSSLPVFKNSNYTPRARTGSNFSPSKYQGLIQEMKKAAFN